MAPTPWRRLAVAAVAGLLGTAGLATGASANAAFKYTRVAGIDRYATASSVAADAFPTGAQTAIIARGDAFADALAGAYLAGLQTGGAPVLLTTTASVPDATKTRLAAMSTKNVILLGGTGAISTAAEQDLAKTYTVTRVAGTNRYDTAAKIAQTTSTLGVGTLSGDKTAIVANGEVYADALAAGPVSYSQRFPILLTRAGDLPAESKAALTALGIKHVVIVGGTTAVSDAVDAALKANGATTERVAGTTRYETATKVADFSLSKLTGWSTTAADLATGEGFADALAGGPAAGRSNRSILLTAPTSLSGPTATWLQAHATTLTSGRLLGGTTAVSEAVRTAAEQAAGASTTSNSGQVTSVDAANDRYTYVPSGATTATTVTYKATDLFTVNGTTADMGGFESKITPADTITYTSGSPAKHDLVDVDATKISSGTIGNINTTPGAQTFAFINPVTGDVLRGGVKYAPTGATYTVDGAAKAVAAFEAELSEGDSLTNTGTAFALTNGTVTGTAGEIANAAPVRTQFKVGVFGDDPASASDDLFTADSTDTFVVQGISGNSTYTVFNDHLTSGDTVTYKRTGGEETYTLVDQAPPTKTGQAVGTVTKNGDLLPANDDTDGGSFTLATSTGSETITYRSAGSGDFYVNGALSNEATFEAKYSAGDTISFRWADDASGTKQRLELTDANLAGAVKASTIDTSETPPNANSYEVLAQNGTTVLSKVTYSPTGDLYMVNGATATAEQFEAELNAIKAGTKTGSVVEGTASGKPQHSLTTATA
jgi:putative cell wall-binding protein